MSGQSKKIYQMVLKIYRCSDFSDNTIGDVRFSRDKLTQAGNTEAQLVRHQVNVSLHA